MSNYYGVYGYDDYHSGHLQNHLGRLPFADGWSNAHQILTRQNERFLAGLTLGERERYLEVIDSFLRSLGERHGYERKNIGVAGRWLSQRGNFQCTDAHMLAESFAEEEWKQLVSLLAKIRPKVATTRGVASSGGNEALALIVVLKLLSQRAAEANDTAAFEKAEEIVADLNGLLFTLACRGALHFESSRKRSGAILRKTVSDNELMRCARSILNEGVSPPHLVSEIRRRKGSAYGGEAHLRRRLQALRILQKRAAKN